MYGWTSPAFTADICAYFDTLYCPQQEILFSYLVSYVLCAIY